jgi:hypothetical protein
MTKDQIATRMNALYMDVVGSCYAAKSDDEKRALLDGLHKACITTLTTMMLAYIKPENRDKLMDSIAPEMRRLAEDAAPKIAALKAKFGMPTP